MPKLIAPETKEAIRDLVKLDQVSQRNIASAFGVSRSVVASVGTKTNYRQPVEFRECKKGYLCDGCTKATGRNITVYVRPCPACYAREAKRRGEKSATEGMKEVRPVSKRVVASVSSEVPGSVVDWVHANLSRRISSGNQVEVKEAAGDLSNRVCQLIESTANVIGEERRERAVAG
jgi:hypothetical protein